MTDDVESLMISNTARAIIREEDVSSYDFINLPAINEEMKINNIHYKYNFIIQPFKSPAQFSIKDHGTRVKLIYPEN